MHLQHESKLLSAPAEIRRAIYANIIYCQIHAFLSQGRILLSECLQPNLGDDYHDGHERETMAEGSSDARWARRLRSSWGAHWECEEVAFAQNTDLHKHSHHCIYNLLFLCKKMFLDVCDFVVKTTAIIVTDLDTLNVLLLKYNELTSGPNRLWNLWDYTRPSIQKLNVALRLPLAFYRALEEDEALVLAAVHHTSAVSTMRTTWVRLWPAVCQLQQLRSLHIWLDHDDPSSWSVIKERFTLHHITAALAAYMQARSRGENLPHMDITFNLPKLHPGIARPDTHFVQESPPLPFTIERRIRQRYHCEESASGNLSVKYKADFPLMHELPGVLEEPGVTLREFEEFEKMLWDEGTDVYQFMVDMFGFVSCF